MSTPNTPSPPRAVPLPALARRALSAKAQLGGYAELYGEIGRINQASVRTIERFIRLTHRVARRGRYHPYFLASDLALVAALGLALVVVHLWGEVQWWRLAAPPALLHVLGYPLFLKLKLKVVGTPARSFLQDTVLFIVPGILLLSLALGVTARTATDYLGLALPVTLAIYRLGCLVGGCCYGRTSARGISYDPEHVVAARTRWRRFDPGPAPVERVLPLQLVDAWMNLTIASLLFVLAVDAPPPVPLLPVYLASYSAARLLIERFRGHRHRPTHGRLSEAQWTALVIIAASGIWMGLGARA